MFITLEGSSPKKKKGRGGEPITMTTTSRNEEEKGPRGFPFREKSINARKKKRGGRRSSMCGYAKEKGEEKKVPVLQNRKGMALKGRKKERTCNGSHFLFFGKGGGRKAPSLLFSVTKRKTEISRSGRKRGGVAITLRAICFRKGTSRGRYHLP